MNTLFSHFTLFVVIGMMLLGSSGCCARAPESSAKTPVGDATPAVTHATSSPEAAPVSLETFAALLDRA